MKKSLAMICCLIFLSNLSISAQIKYKPDSLKVTKLSPQESRVIKNLVKTDTSFVPANMNLQLEIFKYNPNLLYKYRLDSIQKTVSLDYNPYVQTYIDLFLKRKKEMGEMVDLGRYYFPIFEKALAAYDIPSEFKYLPIIESSMNPKAVSRVGATGLWQFMYTTGRMYGLTIDNYIDERRDPIAASYAAAKYLRDAYDDLGDWLLALASYNCGLGNVTRAIERTGGSKSFWEIQKYLPNETRNYVPAFIAANYIMNYYTRYDDIPIRENRELATDSVYVNKFVSFNKIAGALNMDAKELQILNPAYKKDMINGTDASPKRLIIPKIAYKDYPAFFEAMNADEEQKATLSSVSQKPVLNITHIVKKGENLNAIADDYRVEVQDLKVWNNLKSFTLVPGQKLLVSKASSAAKAVPAVKPAYLTYKVKSGDTLAEIADKFERATIKNIKELNNLKSSILTIGMLLKIAVN